MKPSITSLVLFSGLAISTACFGMSTDENKLFQARAKTYLQEITNVKELKCALNIDFFKKFLLDRTTEKKTSNSLHRDLVFYQTMDHLDTDQNAKAEYTYVRMAEENFAYLLRLRLGCHCGPLNTFEQNYETSLEKVDPEEFKDRMCKSYPSGESLFLEASHKFARAIIHEIAEGNFNPNV